MAKIIKQNKIALVEDQQVMREAMSSYLSKYGYETIFQADNGKHMQEFLEKHLIPDLILLDIIMPVMNGFETAKWLKANFPQIPILALSSEDDGASINKIIASGAKGFISKNIDSDHLLEAMEIVKTGGFFVPQRHMQNFFAATQETNTGMDLHKIHLNDKEMELLKMVCTEMSYKEMSDILFMSQRTLEDHVGKLIQKVGVSTRVGLVRYALKSGLVS